MFVLWHACPACSKGLCFSSWWCSNPLTATRMVNIANFSHILHLNYFRVSNRQKYSQSNALIKLRMNLDLRHCDFMYFVVIMTINRGSTTLWVQPNTNMLSSTKTLALVETMSEQGIVEVDSKWFIVTRIPEISDDDACDGLLQYAWNAIQSVL